MLKSKTYVARTRRLLTIAIAGVLGAAAPLYAQQPTVRPASPQASVLRLSMDQAITMALETNLGLKSERLNVDLAAQSIVSAKSAFLPTVTVGVSRNTVSSPSLSFADGTTSITSSSTVAGSGLVRQALPWYGGGLQVTWSGNRFFSPGSVSTFNPRLGSTFRVDFQQPLWQDFKIDPARAGVERSERQRVITDLQLQQRVVATEAAVRAAYLQFVASMRRQEVAQSNMDLAQQSLTNARARVAVGQSPQIDIITSEASVESFREQLIVADAAIQTGEDGLRALVLDPNRADYWQVHIEPTDEIQLTPRQIDETAEAALIANALSSRLDLQSLKRAMEITDLNLSLNKNATHPSVDLAVNYAASGTGGRLLQNDGNSVGLAGVLGDAFGGAYPSWTLGVNVGVPIGRTAALAALAQGQIQKQQEHLNQRDLELQIVQDVRQAVRDVRTAYQRVQATRAAREASDRQLEAEQRKFAVGLSDQFTLQTREGQLASARNSELNAIVAYNNALINLDRVQNQVAYRA